jgi:hypothetical protein
MTERIRDQLVAIASILAVSGLAVAGEYDYPWKDGNSFEIHHVDGVEYSYAPEARITLEVVGRALGTNVPPDPEYGFHVQATIDHPDLTRAISGGNGVWDPGLRGWKIEMKAPQELRDEYRLLVSLYCGQDESECAETYGRAAQVMEKFEFDVR